MLPGIEPATLPALPAIGEPALGKSAVRHAHVHAHATTVHAMDLAAIREPAMRHAHAVANTATMADADAVSDDAVVFRPGLWRQKRR